MKASSRAGAVPLGVSFNAWRGGYRDAKVRLATFREAGFRAVTLIPSYPYADLHRIDLQTGPNAEELAGAIEEALRAGFTVVLKPHLEPLLYAPGFDSFTSDEESWRARCGWRGYFDIDPMIEPYREGVIGQSLEAVAAVKRRAPELLSAAKPIRLELGAELMNAVVQAPQKWVALQKHTKALRRRLGLEGLVELSHNFSHHFAIANDFVERLSPAGKRQLAAYLRGLDAFALSQYTDLTAAMPKDERKKRLPTPDEVAQSLVAADRHLREDILMSRLGLRPKDVPRFHLGEFGIGRGGLQHPNLWEGRVSKAHEESLPEQIAVGHRGLIRYLAMSREEGRWAEDAALWVVGPNFDIFGWGKPSYGVPAAAAAVSEALKAYAAEGR